MKFNENLKYLRKKEGLTQEELAEKLNVSRQSVTKWESGQALPDIEKIKEISYMFSVSVDSLIGDIESKTTNRIKKKINDIGWFLFGFIVLDFVVIASLYNFLSKILKNEDAIITFVIVMIVTSFIVFIIALKAYLKNNKEKILNMKDSREGKKERVRYILKKSIYSLTVWIAFCLMTNICLILEGVNTFMMVVIKSIILGLILDLILFCVEYIKLEKSVKELNKN